MPTYEYACTECAHRLEVVQSFTDASLTECPECTGRLRKVFSPVGVVFKGSGFYKTDSRAKSGASAAGGPSKKDGAKTEPAERAAKPDAAASGTATPSKESAASSPSSSTGTTAAAS